jgi:hypothetical protein
MITSQIRAIFFFAFLFVGFTNMSAQTVAIENYYVVTRVSPELFQRQLELKFGRIGIRDIVWDNDQNYLSVYFDIDKISTEQVGRIVNDYLELKGMSENRSEKVRTATR